jgi:transposase-like protein
LRPNAIPASGDQLALRNITTDWGRAAHDWRAAMNQFAILYEDRFTQATHGI